ncbi:MAG: citrate (Si)-synthase [candidate division Zixibacteria bacterium]|nr:citrate (Si)-synthase [candidate division Zixibacteria bacterium]
MASLKEKFASQIPGLRQELKDLAAAKANNVISEVTVAQAYGGMRGVKGMICDTSVVDPGKGLIIRGIPILEGLTDKWPEEIYWLLLAGKLPTKEEVTSLQKDYADNCEIPGYVWDVMRAMPKESHPMAMLDTAILVMEHESVFRKRYSEGISKTEYWDPVYDDSLKLLAVLPGLAAGIYRIRYGKGDPIPYDKNLDWGANYATMLGIDDPTGEFKELMRLYLTLHCDHEGGNVSANTAHTVASALSDPWYAVSAGLNGLAGPLHGLANQECLGFVLKIKDKFGGVPSIEDLKKFAWDTLNAGKVIPGYGHAVLRCPDPRFVAFRDFGKKHCPDDPVFKIVDMIFEHIPGVLLEHGKAKNPQPNVDAGSGALLHHFGLREFPYYTVLFSVSRAMGMCSQMIINRAIGSPITRPKSVSTEWIKANA